MLLTLWLVCCGVEVLSINFKTAAEPQNTAKSWVSVNDGQSPFPRSDVHPLLGMSSTNFRSTPHSSHFQKVLRKKTFIDRTLLIKYIIDNSPSLHYITAPRKFGKTVNIHMLASFFNPTSTENHTPAQQKPGSKFHPVFSTTKLNITYETSIVSEHMLSHPVIFLDFKKLRVSDPLTFLASFESEVLKPTFKAHEYILTSKILSPSEKDTVNKILTSTASDSAVPEAGRDLLKLLHKHFNQSVVVLIDQFDRPIKKMVTNPVVSEQTIKFVVKFLHKFLSRLFDVDLILLHDRAPFLYSGVMTGTSELAAVLYPNLGVEYIPFNREDISTFYGLTQSEVNHLASLFQATPNETRSLRAWYKGYHVLGSSSRVYNIYSVVSYFKRDEPRKFKPFWVKSGSIGVLRSLFTYEYLGKKVQDCISEHGLSLTRPTKLSMRDVMIMKGIFDAETLGSRQYKLEASEKRLNAILRFLLDEGYFTALDQFTVLGSMSVPFNLPNFEVRSEILSVLYRAAFIKTEIERPTFLQVGSNLTSALAGLTKDNTKDQLRCFLEGFTSLLDLSDFKPRDEVELGIVLGSIFYTRDPSFETIKLFKTKYELMPQEFIDVLMVVKDMSGRLVGYVMELKYRWKSALEALNHTVFSGLYEVFQKEEFEKDFKEKVVCFVLIGLHCAVNKCELQYLYDNNNINDKSEVIVTKRRQMVPRFNTFYHGFR